VTENMTTFVNFGIPPYSPPTRQLGAVEPFSAKRKLQNSALSL
jgi:hypothetical protein